MSEQSGLRIHITGIVQGVGFRPFVYGLAMRYGLTGWVRNTSAGVDIEVEGPPGKLAGFAQALGTEAPPLAHMDTFAQEPSPVQGFSKFEILHSAAIAEAFQPVSPDVSICPDCLRELFDPHDRRYRYPFTNCTNCGPRFTIIKDLPYDRPLTTMAVFPLCPACEAEYQDPLNRRFHAQPVACPECGPSIWLELGESREWRGESGGHPDTQPPGHTGERLAEGEEALQMARRMLAEGKILAVRGLGGFHLACDASNAEAVAELRRRKLRVDKPFAVMMPDLEAVLEHCILDPDEQALLTSHERPIVIVKRRPGARVAIEAAPGQDTLGVMLPYTPLHYLLLERAPGFPLALVMTSGNLSEEPIATGLDEARERLGKLADAFLMHNREIYMRCDDSVVRAVALDEEVDGGRPGYRLGSVYYLRRARGYAPYPVHLPWKVLPILGAGAELKNTFCLAREEYAFLSHHIGDLENYETLQAFEQGVEHYERLFRIKPETIAYDLHPNYLATRYALARAEREGIPAIGIQHHHAHIAAGMAEHGLDGDTPVIGLAFDGTGYGSDGAIWGGEVLMATYSSYRRLYHLNYVPLLGGDKAVREPWRVALSWLAQASLPWEKYLPPVLYSQKSAESHALAGASSILSILRHQLDFGINAPLTSSMGRLFDAAASLAGVRQTVNYEAQAAIEMEMMIDPDERGFYPFQVNGDLLDAVQIIRSLARDVRHGVSVGKIAARFHWSIVRLAVEACTMARTQTGANRVVLSGGVWQNRFILTQTVPLLKEVGFAVYIHRQTPANDGGLALGQVAAAAQMLGR